jgi:hypothetical protein
MNIVEETITNDDGVEQTYYIFHSKVFSTKEDALVFKEQYETSSRSEGGLGCELLF